MSCTEGNHSGLGFVQISNPKMLYLSSIHCLDRQLLEIWLYFPKKKFNLWGLSETYLKGWKGQENIKAIARKSKPQHKYLRTVQCLSERLLITYADVQRESSSVNRTVSWMGSNGKICKETSVAWCKVCMQNCGHNKLHYANESRIPPQYSNKVMLIILHNTFRLHF